jgi:hypothetical protein
MIYKNIEDTCGAFMPNIIVPKELENIIVYPKRLVLEQNMIVFRKGNRELHSYSIEFDVSKKYEILYFTE